MKNLITTLAVVLSSSFALAHSGSHTLSCKSAANSGSKQQVSLKIHRANTVGLTAPGFEGAINGKQFQVQGEDEMKPWGYTTHHASLGVVVININNLQDESWKGQRGEFTVTALPQTVKTYDSEGKPVKWSLKAEQEYGWCADANGKATFEAVVDGYIDDGTQGTTVIPQIMDCELTYNSGMAC